MCLPLALATPNLKLVAEPHDPMFAGGGVYLLVGGYDNSVVTNNTVSLAHVTFTGNTASGGECVVGDHRPVFDPSRT